MRVAIIGRGPERLPKRSLSYPFVHGEDGVDTGDLGCEVFVINRGVCLADGRRVRRPG